MRESGFVSVLLLAAFIPAYFHAAGLSEQVFWQSEGANQRLVEAEKALIIRTELEENTDFIIESALAEQAATGSTAENAKSEIARRLMEYYWEEGEERRGAVSFWNAEFSGGDYSQLLYAREASPLTENNLKNESAVAMTRVGQATEAEFVFTGGILRDRQAFARIEIGKAKMVFVIPRNYSARVVVGG